MSKALDYASKYPLEILVVVIVLTFLFMNIVSIYHDAKNDNVITLPVVIFYK